MLNLGVAVRRVQRDVVPKVQRRGVFRYQLRKPAFVRPLTRKHLLTYTNHMAASMNVPKPDVFMAISHPARREILDLLIADERPVKVIAEHFEMSRPAVSQHLRVLTDAGLVTEQRHGRERRYRLVPESLEPIREWISQYEQFWDDRLRQLQKHVMKGNKK